MRRGLGRDVLRPRTGRFGLGGGGRGGRAPEAGLVALALLLVILGAVEVGAEVRVSFDRVEVLDGRGTTKTVFLPGEEVQVRARLRVLESSAEPFTVRLRIMGDGWFQVEGLQVTFAPGVHWVVWGGGEHPIHVPAEASPGKVACLVDLFSGSGEPVEALGTRHGYLSVRCPEGLPRTIAAEVEVGRFPYAMALTRNGRHLYVTSQADRKITVLDARDGTLEAEILDPEQIGQPAGVAAGPDGREMLVADSTFQVLHVIDAVSHRRIRGIELNPEGRFGRLYPGALAVSPLRREAYVADLQGARLIRVGLSDDSLREIPLSPGLFLLPTGLLPARIVVDPENPAFLYVLCQGLNEVVKVDTSGRIVDFVQLRNVLDPASYYPAWSLALSPVSDELYVLVTPEGIEETFPEIRSKIYVLRKNHLAAGPVREFFAGTSLWDLVSVAGSSMALGVDSWRSQVLVIDLLKGIELAGCGISLGTARAGRLILYDPPRGRLFVGAWSPGSVGILKR